MVDDHMRQLIDELLTDKCMVPNEQLPGIYEYRVRPLSLEAARALQECCDELGNLRGIIHDALSHLEPNHPASMVLHKDDA